MLKLAKEGINEMPSIPFDSASALLKTYYKRERGEVFQSPRYTLANMSGDCEDQVIALASLYMRHNKPFQILIVGFGKPEHVLLYDIEREKYMDMLPDWAKPDSNDVKLFASIDWYPEEK